MSALKNMPCPCCGEVHDTSACHSTDRGAHCAGATGSAPFFAWLESSEWAGAGKDAGELARAAWSAAAEAIYDRLYPLWEKCRKQRGEHFRAFEDTKATEERDGYFWEEGAERAYRDALNIATRVAREPNGKVSDGR